MAQVRKVNSKEEPQRPRPKAKSIEGRENQLVGLAVDLAERQLRDGTAPAQVVVQLLKSASPRERLERERLQRENELLRSRVEALESGQRVEALYDEAIRAMRAYSGQDPVNVDPFE